MGDVSDERLEPDEHLPPVDAADKPKPKTLGMSSKFTGELGLLKSLNQLEARRALRQETFEKDNPGLTTIAAADKATLKTFRVVPGAETARDEAAEREAVLALPHSFPTVHRRRTGSKLASEEPSERLVKLRQTREQRHEAAVVKFEEDREAIKNEVESKVTALAASLKQELQVSTDRIQQLFDKLGTGDALAANSMGEVRQGWADMEAQCLRHRQAIEAFGTELSTVEKDRAARVLERVQKLAFDLVSIGHALPDSVERFIEGQTEPVNLVVLRNARAYATMMARLQKKDVALFLATRARHRNLVREWRALRHNEVIQRFNSRVDSEEFVDPQDRQALFEDARHARKNRHTKSRLKVLQKLRSLVPPILDSKVVAALKNNLAEINKEEEDWLVSGSLWSGFFANVAVG